MKVFLTQKKLSEVKNEFYFCSGVDLTETSTLNYFWSQVTNIEGSLMYAKTIFQILFLVTCRALTCWRGQLRLWSLSGLLQRIGVMPIFGSVRRDGRKVCAYGSSQKVNSP